MLPRQEPVSRRRRFRYIAIVTAYCLMVSTATVLLGFDSAIAGKLIDAMMEVVQVLVISYVGASVVDRSELVTRLGERIGRNRPNVGPNPPQ